MRVSLKNFLSYISILLGTASASLAMEVADQDSVELHFIRHSPLFKFSLPDKSEVHVNSGNQVWVKTAEQSYPATPWETYASANKFHFKVNVRQGNSDSMELLIPRGSKPFSFFAESEVAVDHASTWVKEKNGPGFYATPFDKFAQAIGLPNAKAVLVDLKATVALSKVFAFQSIGDCFAVFKDINKNTFSDLQQKAQLGDLNALRKLQEFKEALIALKHFKYMPRGSNLDKAINGIETAFIQHAQAIMKLLESNKEKLLSISVKGTETYPSSTPSERANIFNQNQVVSEKGYFFQGKPIIIDTQSTIKGTKVYGYMDDDYKPNLPLGIKKYNTKFVVHNADTLDYAIGMRSQGLNPLVLDMANASLICGAAKNGHGNVQEERIAYRSNLYAPLQKVEENARLGKTLGLARNFIPREGGILVPQVTIFRHGEDKGYAFMDTLVRIDIGAIAAYRHESRILQGKEADIQIYGNILQGAKYWQSTKRKVYAFLDMALENGNDSLLLSALGCGAFKNPVEDMVQVFQGALQEYDGCFKEIHFAILTKNENTDPNFVHFKKAFAPH